MNWIRVAVLCVTGVLQACAAEAGPCRDAASTARLLRDSIATRWADITPAELMTRWPGLERSSESEPPILSVLVRDAADDVVCGDYFYFAGPRGLRSITVFSSGTPNEMVDAAKLLSAAIGAALRPEEERKLIRDKSIVSQRRASQGLQQVTIEIAETATTSHLTFRSGWLSP